MTLATDSTALARIRPSLGAWLRQGRVRATDADDVVLATWEAAVNAVEHSRGATFQIGGDIASDAVSVCVADGGDWVERTVARPEGGSGIALIRALMDDVRIDHGRPGTRVLMHKKLDSSSEPASEQDVSAPVHVHRDGAGAPFRVVVVVDGERTVQFVMPFEQPPQPGDAVPLPSGEPATIRHVLEAPRGDLAGIVLAWKP